MQLKTSFSLNKKQTRRVVIWKANHKCSIKEYGAIGGALSYTFTPNSIGITKIVSCACGATLNVTNYDEW